MWVHGSILGPKCQIRAGHVSRMRRWGTATSAATGICPFVRAGEALAKELLFGNYPLTVGKQNPYVDYRLGGVPKYYLTPRKDIDMLLPNEILKSVVFLGKKRGEEIRYGGTGFL